MLVERAFARVAARKLAEFQAARGISDDVTARHARVSQSYWCRVRMGAAAPGVRLISGLAASMPDLLRSAIDEVQELRRIEIEHLQAGGADSGEAPDLVTATGR